MAKHNEVGKWGEDIAVETLVAKGCAIVARNWRMGAYEVDIIAMKGRRIIFVEVKTRTATDDNPLDAVDRKKMMRIARAANAYVQAYDIPHEVQFDLISIIGTKDNYKVVHEEDAFYPPLKTYR